jgi:pimeloyl-ACP methyl ester carboxylesterase
MSVAKRSRLDIDMHQIGRSRGRRSFGGPADVRVDMASQAWWMLELLDALGLAHAAVVAHDVGSAAAQLMVVSAPQRISGLVVLDGVYALTSGQWTPLSVSRAGIRWMRIGFFRYWRGGSTKAAC